MSIRTLFAAAAVIGLATLAQPASAAVITFEGVVSDGTYVVLRDGVLTQGSLAGESFRLRTVLRTPDPTIREVVNPAPYSSTYDEYAPTDAANNTDFYSVFTLGGVDYDIGDSYEYVSREQDAAGAPYGTPGFITTLAYTQQTDPHFPIVKHRVEAEILSNTNAFLYGIDQFYNVSYQPLPGEADGDFRLYFAPPSLVYAYVMQGNLDIRSITITGGQDVPGPPTTGVPEPAAWAMMIAGFGLAGAVLRRRKAGALAA